MPHHIHKIMHMEKMLQCKRYFFLQDLYRSIPNLLLIESYLNRFSTPAKVLMCTQCFQHKTNFSQKAPSTISFLFQCFQIWQKHNLLQPRSCTAEAFFVREKPPVAIVFSTSSATYTSLEMKAQWNDNDVTFVLLKSPELWNYSIVCRI